MSISGSTELAGIIGTPVRHSLSPALHNAAYAALGLDWVYLAFEVPKEHFETAVAGAGALGMRGLSVTMPHKEHAASLATRSSDRVRQLGAANTLSFAKGEVVADSTDGEGLLDDLREALGFDPEHSRCGVIGAGGSARAVILALAEAGALEILVVNRTGDRARLAASIASDVARVAQPEELEAMDLVVTATPAGMEGLRAFDPEPPGGPHEIEPTRLGSGQVAVDLVYHPS
ncbi:MAG: shikimate dehydrogenase, partial [Acidimicrobiales bacterium]